MVEAIQICVNIGRQGVCVAELRLQGPAVRALVLILLLTWMALDK